MREGLVAGNRIHCAKIGLSLSGFGFQASIVQVIACVVGEIRIGGSCFGVEQRTNGIN